MLQALASRLAAWAAASIPAAMPLTTPYPASASSLATRVVTLTPYEVGVRVPTTAMTGRRRSSRSPSAKRMKGGWPTAPKAAGYRGSSGVRRWAPSPSSRRRVSRARWPAAVPAAEATRSASFGPTPSICRSRSTGARSTASALPNASTRVAMRVGPTPGVRASRSSGSRRPPSLKAPRPRPRPRRPAARARATASPRARRGEAGSHAAPPTKRRTAPRLRGRRCAAPPSPAEEGRPW
jgi:hypothetical protein